MEIIYCNVCTLSFSCMLEDFNILNLQRKTLKNTVYFFLWKEKELTTRGLFSLVGKRCSMWQKTENKLILEIRLLFLANRIIYPEIWYVSRYSQTKSSCLCERWALFQPKLFGSKQGMIKEIQWLVIRIRLHNAILSVLKILLLFSRCNIHNAFKNWNLAIHFLIWDQ